MPSTASLTWYSRSRSCCCRSNPLQFARPANTLLTLNGTACMVYLHQGRDPWFQSYSPASLRDWQLLHVFRLMHHTTGHFRNAPRTGPLPQGQPAEIDAQILNLSNFVEVSPEDRAKLRIELTPDWPATYKVD